MLNYDSDKKKRTQECVSKFQMNLMKMFYVISFKKVDPFYRKIVISFLIDIKYRVPWIFHGIIGF